MMNVKLKIISIFFILISMTASVYAGNVKKAEFAGSFYPGDRKALSSMIDEFLAEANAWAVEGKILGVISPHAGYIYSGPVAAYSFKSLQNKKFDTVIILGSSHRYRFKGISVYGKGAFNTPLGKLGIDKGVASKFSSLEFAQSNKDYFNNEHSLEVQLPFIIKVLGRPKIVPVLFGEVSFGDLEEVAAKFGEISQEKRILVIVSTDLSHYQAYQQAVRIDSQTLDLIKNKDVSSLWQSWRGGEGRACGMCPLIAFLMYVKNQAADIEILKYANSGDTAGDKSRVVGYVSGIAFKINNEKLKIKNEKAAAEKEVGMAGYSLNDDEKVTLLRIARSTLESFLKDGQRPQVSVSSGNLKVNKGAFVTLHKNGQLRGCIGTMVADTPLYKVIPEFAVYSATRDRRFTPVVYEELADIEIEISVLTDPLYLEFSSAQELLDKLQPLRDGVIITTKYGSSTYLPQVWEQIPGREEFLSNLCAKGGAPYDYWERNFKDIKVQTYQAIVFNESQFSDK
ncbi:MAG: AmmeMemoRadiSam system protein B [Candidatus Omnitrophota bacterium]|nr:MAG: AmmeMemoRadiSam system protein B [Candidatus Omnitrophota bacterium]